MPRCAACGWEAIQLPDGGVMCAHHGRFDEAGDEARRHDLGHAVAALQLALARGF